MSISGDRLTAFFSTLQAELLVAKLDSDYSAYAVRRQHDRARKKAIFPGQERLAELAVNRFKSVNEKVSQSVCSLSPAIVSNARHFVQNALENYTTAVRDYNVQVSLDFLHLYDLWGFGPGASFGTKATHPAQKMYEQWSCTPSALEPVIKLRRNHPYLYLADKVSDVCHPYIVDGSKLATVPKNEERNRTIAIEPLGNMVLQLAAGRYLEGALRRLGLNIKDQQPKNKEAARRGSLDGSLATIDLQDASDMFSPELVRLLLPDAWYKLLMQIRSPCTKLPNGEVIQLNMISTMGNGFTFPLMTLILLGLVYGTFCVTNKTRSLYIDWERVCVFGDDIIVPSDTFDDVACTIEAAGLIVNRDKSYSEGPFRESCGGDYFKGVDVTPFYVKTLEDNPDVYVALNQVLEWTARQKVSLPKTIDLLLSFVEGPAYFVPEWSNPDSGIRTTRVSPRYKGLVPKPARFKFENNEFATPLAVGGFLISDGLSLFYTPRQYKTRYVAKKFRLPRGFLDGRDPVTRSLPVSHAVDLELIARGLGYSGI